MSKALLTFEQVAGWQQRIGEIDSELRALADERRGLEKKLDAVQVILGGDLVGQLGEDVDSPSNRDTTGASERLTWPEELTRIFNEAGRPLTFVALKGEVERGRLAGDFRRSDKGFYHAISRLQDRGFLIKHNGWLFRVTDFENHMNMVRAGERADVVEDTASRPSPMGDEITAFLRGCTDGATNAEIIDHLIKDDRFTDTLTKNKSGAYNVIARMVRRGELLKDGRQIRLFKENEPPKGGSETEEVSASSEQEERYARRDALF